MTKGTKEQMVEGKLETNDKGGLDPELITKIVQLFEQEVIPAEGCTEPIAIALAAAKAREVLGLAPQRMHIILSGNIIKNVKSVIVPNSGGLVGIEVSAAMGALYGDATQQLMVISKITPSQMTLVKQFLAKDTISISRADNNLKLYVKVEAYANGHMASVELKYIHTNISEIIKDGVVLQQAIEAKTSVPLEDAAGVLNVKLIYKLAKTIDLNLISARLARVIECNSAISKEGLQGNYGVNAGKNIEHSIKLGFYGDDVRNRAASAAAAGSDARMGGSAMPVMTAAGSGNVGLTATLPIITYCRSRNLEQDLMYRGLFFSILTTIHIKANIGRLSAYCGPMCAAAAVAGALVFLNDAPCAVVEKAIINTLAGVSGVFCDGANSSCAVKIANGTYAAFDGAAMALNNNVITPGDGIVADDVEGTINNVAELARNGMQETDEVILAIMTRYKSKIK